MATSEKIDRHCALCLQVIRAKRVKKHLCPHCLRRAYCSKACQKMDWISIKNQPNTTSSCNGHGHADWCKLQVCEEDLDWIVGPSEKNHHKNGLGLFAKHFIPSKSRIMVEKDSNTVEQFPYGQIRMANHDCKPNACLATERDFDAAILYANRDIQPGEEICRNFLPLSKMSEVRPLLQMLGVVCPANCFCRNEAMDDLISMEKEGWELLKIMTQTDITKMIQTPEDVGEALKVLKNLLEIHAKLGGPWIQKLKLSLMGFHLGIFQSRTLKFADKCKEACLDILARIVHPDSDSTKSFVSVMENPQVVLGYLSLDDKPEGEGSAVFGEDDIIEHLMTLI